MGWGFNPFTGKLDNTGSGGGGGTPGGADTQVQFNDGGAFGGITGATTDGTTVTLVTPTIASFTNAQHNHTNAAGGGTIAYSSLTGLPTLVTAHSALTGLTTGDDHTQYALLAGRSGGQTLIGDSASGTGVLTLRGGTGGVQTGRTDIDKITLFSGTQTLTASAGDLIRTNGDITVNYTSGNVGSMVKFDANVFHVTNITSFTSVLFNFLPVVSNDPSTSGVTYGSMGGFVGQSQQIATTYDTRQEKQWTFLERSIFGAGSGTVELYNPQWYRYYAANQTLGNLRTGGRVRDHVAFYSDATNVAGTGILHNSTVFGAANQTTARDFNYFIYGNTGLSRFGDDLEIDSLGTKGLILHPTTDTRYRYTAKDYTGAIQSSEVAFDPFTDIPWYFATDASTANVGSVADLADVTRWADKSGNGRDLTIGAGTSNPRWENSLALHNNQPAVEFTAANTDSLEYATAATQGSISLAATYTAVFVLSFKSVAAAQRFFNHQTGVTRGAGITATPQWDTRMGATAVAGGTPVVSTMYYVRILGTGAAQTLYATPIATGAETSVATNAVAAGTFTQLVIGAHKSAVPAYTTPFDGYMSFAAIYSGDLSTHPQYQRFLEYLNTAYGFGLTTTSVAQGSNTHPLTTNADITAVGNVGAGEDDLMTYSLPASFLSTNGDSMYFEAAGTVANNANAKRIRVKFGATTILDTGAAGIAVATAYDWVVRGRVVRTGAATQDIYCSFVAGTTLNFSDFTTATETLSGAVTFKLTGEATSNNDIVQELMINGVDGS